MQQSIPLMCTTRNWAFCLFLLDFWIGDFLFQTKCKQRFLVQDFSPEQYKITTLMQKEKLLSKKMKELSGFIHLNLGNWRFFVSERILTSSPPYFSFSFINTKLSIFRECWKLLLEKLGKGHHLVPLYPISGTKTTYTSATSNQLHENQTNHVADYLQQHQHVCHKENSPLSWFVTDVWSVWQMICNNN